MTSPLSSRLALLQITTVSGETVVTPLVYPQMAWVGSSAQAMSTRMARAVQEKLVDVGHDLDTARLADPAAFERRDAEVSFAAGRDALPQPARSARSVTFLSTKGAGGHALVPALGIVALAEPERLQDAVADAIRQEHRRRGRLSGARLRVAEMDGARARRVLALFAGHAQSALRGRIDAAALDTSYRLLERYVRYEGFPGKAVRFLGECVRTAIADDISTVTEAAAIAGFVARAGLPEVFLRDDRPLVESELHAFFAQRLFA